MRERETLSLVVSSGTGKPTWIGHETHTPLLSSSAPPKNKTPTPLALTHAHTHTHTKKNKNGRTPLDLYISHTYTHTDGHHLTLDR